MTKIKANQLEIAEILNDPLAQATETRNGTLEIATQAEVNGGSPYDNTLAITPLSLSGFSGLGEVNNNWLIANNAVDFLFPPTATGTNAIALGRSAEGNGTDDIAIGNTSKSITGVNNISIGAYTSNTGTGGVAVGFSAKTVGIHSTAVGFSALANAESSIAIGDNSRADQIFQIAIGADISSTSTSSDPAYAVKLGYGTTVNKNLLFLHDKGKLELVGDEAQFIFPNYSPTGSPATALPSTTNEGGSIYDFDTKTLKFYNGTGWTELNSNNWLTANSGNDFLTAPTALFSNAITIGQSASSTASNAIAVGTNVTASINSVSIGIDSDTFGSSSIAIGSNAQSGTASEGATIAVGLNSSSVLGSQVSVGNGVTAASITPTDVQFSTKIGYGVADANKNMLHLFSKGKLELYGDEAQFIMPNYSVTGSPTDVPSVGVEGGVIYDSVAKGLQVYDGTSWSALAGGAGLANVVEDLSPQLGGDLDTNTFDITIESTFPTLKFHETDSPATEKYWNITADAGILQFRTANDTGDWMANIMAFTRGGTTPTGVRIYPKLTLDNGEIFSLIADGSPAEAFSMSSPSYVTAGAKLLSIKNLVTEKLSVDLNGAVVAAGGVDSLTSATTVIDVSSADAPTTGQVLTATNGTAATWQTPTGGGGSPFITVLDDLADVIIGGSPLIADQVLAYDGTNWINAPAGIANVVEDLTPQLGGDLNASNNNVANAKTVTFNSEIANSGTGSQTVDFTLGQKQLFTITGATSITLTPPAGVSNFVLRLINPSTNITWVTTILWPGGTEPTWTTTGTDIISFYYDGTNFYGMAGLAFA